MGLYRPIEEMDIPKRGAAPLLVTTQIVPLGQRDLSDTMILRIKVEIDIPFLSDRLEANCPRTQHQPLLLKHQWLYISSVSNRVKHIPAPRASASGSRTLSKFS